MNTISSTDTLIIRSRSFTGQIFVDELGQQARNDIQIQRLIDETNGSCQVVSVWRVECHDLHGFPMLVEDISDRYDLRTVDEVEEMSKRVPRPYSTLNHAQQGLRS